MPLPLFPAVFKYPAYWHVVWEVGSQAAWDNCDYTEAQFIGNDTAGVGPGFWVTATKEKQYLACGVFGHCELGQKVRDGGRAILKMLRLYRS